MKTLDRTLAQEIKKANGDGGREAKFALMKKIDAAAKEMSRTDIRTQFNELAIKHGRAVTAICIAATIWIRRERLELTGWRIRWAQEVLACWTTKPKTVDGLHRAYIDDGIHPTAILDYAASFINFSSEDY